MNSPRRPRGFPDLPTEIRLMIWDLLEPPTRLVGQVPCSNCGVYPPSALPKEYFSTLDRALCKATNHPRWDFKYIVHPRSCAIFPPLHVCRESRYHWLRRCYWKAPRYVRSTDYICRVRFDVPFINYESDIFTVFEVLAEYRRQKAWRPKADFIPEQAFAGLDLDRIRYVGIRENAAVAWNLLSLIPFHLLPALESLTLVTFGPVPRSLETGSPPEWLEMKPTQAQHFECHLRDLKAHPTMEFWVLNHRLFNYWRPTAQTVVRRETSTLPLDDSITLIEALVWHLFVCLKKQQMTQEVRARGLMQTPMLLGWLESTEAESRSEYNDPWDRASCPFRLLCCGLAGHSRADMMAWEPRLKITCKYLCEEEWLVKFDSLNVFAEHPTRDQLQEFTNFVKENYKKSR